METIEILEKIERGELSAKEAEQYFRRQPYEELGYAKLDMHRKLRSGFAEVVFCSGEIGMNIFSGIYKRLWEEEGEVLGTRATKEQYDLVKKEVPAVTYDPLSRILKIEKEGKERIGKIAVCTAGTADIPVAEEGRTDG